MTYFELDLNTLVLISQANLLYLHTPYTMGSQEITVVLLNVVAVLYCTFTQDRDRVRVHHRVSNMVMIRFSLSIRESRFIIRLAVCSHYAVLDVDMTHVVNLFYVHMYIPHIQPLSCRLCQSCGGIAAFSQYTSTASLCRFTRLTHFRALKNDEMGFSQSSGQHS